jgi:hypothetical protein
MVPVILVVEMLLKVLNLGENVVVGLTNTLISKTCETPVRVIAQLPLVVDTVCLCILEDTTDNRFHCEPLWQ